MAPDAPVGFELELTLGFQATPPSTPHPKVDL